MGKTPYCNSTLETSYISEIPIAGPLTFHRLVEIVVGVCTAISVGLSLYLMSMHATHYSNPSQQKHILRILFMVPVYAATCMLCTAFYGDFVYFTVIMNAYEAVAVISFFHLICSYVAPTVDEQENWLISKPARPWIFPMNIMYSPCGGQKGLCRTPRTALTQFNIIGFLIFQYCLFAPLLAIAAIILEAVGRYCVTSNSPAFGHLWINVITALTTLLSMYGVFQAYWSLRHKFNSQRLSFKLLCIKLVIFFTFWQTLVISIATAGAAKKPNKYIYQTDLQVVFNYLVLAIEMVIFAVMHLHAYSYKEYIVSPILSVNTYQGGAFGWRAFVDCFNYADLAYGIARYSYWMFVRRSHRHEEHSMRAKELGLHRDHEGLIPTTTPYTPLEAMQYPQKG